MRQGVGRDPDLVSLGRDSSVDTTVLTDTMGRATFDLRAQSVRSVWTR